MKTIRGTVAGSWAVETESDEVPADERSVGRASAEPPRGALDSVAGVATGGGPAASTAVVPARRAFALVAGSLVVVALLRAPAAVHTGEGMPPGTTRDLVLALARPFDRFTRAVGLDWPDERLGALFGHEPDRGGWSLATAASLVQGAPGDRASVHPGTRVPAPVTPTLAPPRVPTAADPLRLLVTGDSLTESLGPMIANTAPSAVRARTDTRYGTGLVRPDFFDWASHAQEQVAARAPEAVVVALGLNIKLEGSDSLDNPSAVKTQ